MQEINALNMQPLQILKAMATIFLLLVLVKFYPLITNLVLFFVQTVLFLSYFTVNIPSSWIDFQKNIFWAT